MLVDVCTISTPALVAFLLLPSLLGLGTIATVSRLSRTNRLKTQSSNIKLAALQTAPLTAGSLASLVILREPSPKLVLVVGALALIPLVQTLYATDVRVHTTTTVTTPKEGHSLSLNGHARKDKPSLLKPRHMDEYRSLTTATSKGVSSRTSFTLSPVPGTPVDVDSGAESDSPLPVITSSLDKGFKRPTCSRTPSRTSPGPITMPPNSSATLAVTTPITAISSAATSASSTVHNTLSEAQLDATTCPRTHPSTPCAFEAEFVRMLMRSSARAATRAEEPAPFESWPKEWPVFWEGAGLAPKGCW